MTQRLRLTLGQLEAIAIAMDDATLDVEIRGEALAAEPSVRVRTLPAGGVGITVTVDLVSLGRAELAEVLLDRLGCAVPISAPQRRQALPGPLGNGMRATRKTYA